MARKAQGREARKASSGRASGAQRAKRGGGSDERTGYSAKIRERQVAKNSKKGGCVPKLFMLLLPLVAAGTYLMYLVLRS